MSVKQRGCVNPQPLELLKPQIFSMIGTSVVFHTIDIHLLSYLRYYNYAIICQYIA